MTKPDHQVATDGRAAQIYGRSTFSVSVIYIS